MRVATRWCWLCCLAALFVSTAAAQDVIEDPELAGVVTAEPATQTQTPAEPNGEVRVVLRSRLGVDVQWQSPREDIFEATQLALFEARVRRSEHLRFEVGLRARHVLSARERGTPDADPQRYELDVAPTAAFADVTASDALHLRLGYQTVQLGRFDVLSASDVLSARDLRAGPTTLPEASELAQPALRVDWDPAPWLGLRALALPFFQPHLVHVTDGDYALLAGSDGDFDALGGALLTEGDAQRYAALARRTLSRSGQALLARSALSAFTPEPSFEAPQAALRAVAHGPEGELGLTLAIAREHMPALLLSDAFLGFVQNPTPFTQDDLLSDPRPVQVRYGRHGVVSLDGASELGPFLLGAELAYLAGRTLFAVPREPGSPASPETSPLARPGESDLAHFGLRLEHTQSDTFLFALEASAERALGTPRNRARRWLFLADERWLLAGVAFVAFAMPELGHKVELAGGVLNGPSYLLSPRLEQRLFEGVYAEAGAHLIGGKSVPAGDPNASLGGLYDDADQVFLGVYWLP